MWVYSKSRGEHDHRFLMNLDQCSRINLTHLGERWFIELMHGSETTPIAQVNSEEEAGTILQEIFDSLLAAKPALDLDAKDSVSPGAASPRESGPASTPPSS